MIPNEVLQRIAAHCFYRHGIQYDGYTVIDTVKVAKQSSLPVPNFKLETLKHYLGINTTSHSAINDCMVTGSLYYHCRNLIII